MRMLIGIVIGALAAMMFPQEAMIAYDFVRDSINSVASAIAEKTG